MNVLEWIFWACLAIVVYTYILYPIFVVAINLVLRRHSPEVQTPQPQSVSIVLCAHNEEQNLPRRIVELSKLIATIGGAGEIIVVSDGSTDRSAEIARQHSGVRVVELPEKQGKAAALSAGAAVAGHEILVFADARQHWADDALMRLVENFADPSVGAVSGDLVLESAPGVLAGVGLYWRFEKWLRMQESRLGSQVGVTGAISAVRRNLFRPIPPGTLLDDVYWPMMVVLHGYRVIHDERAQAFDRLPDQTQDEFRRKVRTQAGNLQLLTLLPGSALLPWSNPVWWQWLSHKLLRLVVPWALLGMLISNLLLVDDPMYAILLALQACGYGLALLGLVPALAQRVRILGTAASVIVLNAAAFVAFWVWIAGRAGKSWHKAQYQAPAGE
jgi:cellulose synthase/poly-beta-1,6-N-acetylglucosamine synthase-like glycosyltransferase